ncbi:MAG: nicotinamide mononucleotide [Bacteroidetes bacterium]|nr:MAG: nicotinamide mononucleotide [Bacteroidota bacterium]
MTDFLIVIQNYFSTNWLEAIAAVLGIASVWYARRENILVFPTGIVSVLIYIYICFVARLYADAGIQVFYAGMSVYGWYNWTRKTGDSDRLAITVNSRTEQFIGIAATFVLYWIILGIIWYFNQDDMVYMRSYVPWVDSFTTAVFLIGMLLMARKKLENWIYWIIGNIISIPLYFIKGLAFTSFQYLIFLILAVLAFMEWHRRWIESQKAC